jgi:hypothetical protein
MTRFTACGKTQIVVIPRRAARRGISLFLQLNLREIPHFVRNDKINYFFRSLFSDAFLVMFLGHQVRQISLHAGQRFSQHGLGIGVEL